MIDVLIGGMGFLGVNLAEVLAGKGHRVIVVGRRGSEVKRPGIAGYLRSLGVELRLGGKIDAEFLEAVGGDTYYHLAGVISGSFERHREAHVGLLERVLEAVQRTGSRLVYISSIGAIGEVANVKPGSTLYEEEVHLDPSKHKHHGYHEITKAEGERLIVSRSSQLKGRWSILRPGLLMGPWGYHFEWKVYKLLLSLRLAPKLGRGLPIVHVMDVAEIAGEAGEGAYNGLWLNIVSPYYPDFGDLVIEGCRQLKRKCITVPVGWSLVFGGLAPRGSPMALSWSLLRLNYRYSSRHLKRREWRDPEAMVRDFLEWVQKV